MTHKADTQKLRSEYQALDQRLSQKARDRFMEYLNMLIARYGVRFKSSDRLNVVGTLKNLGAGGDDQNLFTNWLEGKNDPLHSNHSRENHLDLFLRFHLYEFELDENQPLDFTSVCEAFDRMLDKLGQEPLYIFNRADFRVMLAMKLQSYEAKDPRDIFVEIYETYKTLAPWLLKTLSKPLPAPSGFEGMSKRRIVVTEDSYSQFTYIRSLGDASDTKLPASGDSITAVQFIRRYREDFDRVRVTPFLILSECFSNQRMVWDTIDKRQITNQVQENLAQASVLTDDPFDPAVDTLPMPVKKMLRSFVKALQYGSTLDRSSLILFCALFFHPDQYRRLMGKSWDRDKLLEHFNDQILDLCGYSRMDPDQPPKSKEEFAVMAAIRNADLRSSHGYPLGEYICEVFLECDFARIMDPVTAAIFAK